jgi:uncharacterized membrane protein HdeD (DUF308 family)
MRHQAALILVFGVHVFVDGIFAVAAGIGMRRQIDRWWLIVLEGAAGIILGLLTFRSPDTTALVLLTFIAAWLLRRFQEQTRHQACSARRSSSHALD